MFVFYSCNIFQSGTGGVGFFVSRCFHNILFCLKIEKKLLSLASIKDKKEAIVISIKQFCFSRFISTI